MPRRIFFSVGEPSGDLHAAGLIRELKKLDPFLDATGFGGPKMSAVGFDALYDLTQLAVVGFVEVLPKLREFFGLKAMAREQFKSQQYDAVVLVDMPGFNWHIAAEATKANIPVFYYMPPQLWAWGQWRIKKMKRTVNHVLCALPMEQRYFKGQGMDAELVGHPFFEHVDEHPLDQESTAKLLRRNRLRVAVLPGSRRRELESIFPLQLTVIQELHRRFPDYHFDVACLNEQHSAMCKSILDASEHRKLPIDIHTGKTSEVIAASTCVLMKSGSVSLELMARRKPACVIYQASHSTYALGKLLSSVKYISLPNIIANDAVVPEYLAIGASKRVLAPLIESMSELMGDDEARKRQIACLDAVRALCGGNQASSKAANAIFQRMRWLNTPKSIAA